MNEQAAAPETTTALKAIARRLWHLNIESMRTNDCSISSSRTFEWGWLKACRYALIDAQHREHLPPAVPAQSLCPTELRASEHLTPLILDLDALKPDQSAWLVEKMDDSLSRQEQPPVSALLQSSASPDVVAVHLSRRQMVKSGVRSAWLRLHDPWVFIQLARVFNQAELARMFGPVQEWVIYLGGDWHRCSIANSPTHDPSDGRCQGVAWEALQRIECVNRSLVSRGWLGLNDIVDRSEHLDALTRRAATKWGMTRASDMAAFATLGAELHLDFDEHPLIREVTTRWQDSEQGNDPSS